MPTPLIIFGNIQPAATVTAVVLALGNATEVMEYFRDLPVYIANKHISVISYTFEWCGTGSGGAGCGRVSCCWTQ